MFIIQVITVVIVAKTLISVKAAKCQLSYFATTIDFVFLSTFCIVTILMNRRRSGKANYIAVKYHIRFMMNTNFLALYLFND